jgi:uncharacterized SAM-binding protein YcdF (DUF218 family)
MTDREKFIALIDNDRIAHSDAIVLLEGDGLNRCETAVSLFTAGYADSVYFSGDITDRTYGSFPFSDIKGILLEMGIPETSLFHEDKSKNTREQAIQIVGIAKKSGWRRIILVASHYHMYRAFLTFLKVAREELPELAMYAAPCRNLPWFSETGWGRRFDLIEQEFERIEKYSQLGHMATFTEAIEYQRWKETI